MRKLPYILKAVLATLAISACIPLAAKPVVPPKGGVTILLKEPVWLTGTAEPSAIYSTSYPQPVKTERFEIVNAGFWLANQTKPTQVIYEFTLRVIKPFEKRVYTRVLLSDPENAARPIKYEHYLDPQEKSTKATHGPLAMVSEGAKYSMTFEVFADENRTELIEKITQELTSPLDNTSGCVGISNELKSILFPGIKSLMTSKKIPIEKVNLACDL